MVQPTLYQQVLGEDFYRLPSVLQRFHGLPEGGRAAGVIAVRHRRGTLRRAAARALQLPPAGEAISLRLEVTPDQGRERWLRHFDGHCLDTLQWAEGTYLVEQTGPLCLVFKLEADEQGLTFHLQHTRLRGKAVSPRLAVNVWARASIGAKGVGTTEDHWRIEVRIAAPGTGPLVTYSGDIFPLPC